MFILQRVEVFIVSVAQGVRGQTLGNILSMLAVLLSDSHPIGTPILMIVRIAGQCSPGVATE